MSDYKYGKITQGGGFTFAPRNFECYSNFNVNEELMLDNGYLPFIPGENPHSYPNMRYDIPEDKIKVTFINSEGEEETRETSYITQIYEDYDFEYYRNQKKEQINNIKLKQLEIGAPVKLSNNGSTYHIQLDADGKANVLGIKAKVHDGKYNKPTDRISFKTYENEILELTASQFLNLADAAFAFSEYVVFEKEKLYQMIDLCITKEQLNDIQWENPTVPLI